MYDDSSEHSQLSQFATMLFIIMIIYLMSPQHQPINHKITNKKLPILGDVILTSSNHSFSLFIMADIPCGIQLYNIVPIRSNNQQTYRPQAAVYSSWILASPIHRDISLRPKNTTREIALYFRAVCKAPGNEKK